VFCGGEKWRERRTSRNAREWGSGGSERKEPNEDVSERHALAQDK